VLIALALVVAASALVLLLARATARHGAHSRAAFPPSGVFVDAGGVRVHALDRGTGSPVVMLHGADGTHLDFSGEVLEAVARTHRAIVIDRPGHGYSDRLPRGTATVEAQSDVLHATLRALGVERAIVVGHSWGGALALGHALRHPESTAGIVLLAGLAFDDPGVVGAYHRIPTLPVLGPALAATLLVPLGRVLMAPSLAKAFAPDRVPAGEVASTAAFSLRPAQFEVNAEDMRLVNGSLRALAPGYPSIAVPVVIVAGDADRIVDPERHAYPLHRAIAHSELIVLPATGHQIPHTRPGAVAAAIARAERPHPHGR